MCGWCAASCCPALAASWWYRCRSGCVVTAEEHNYLGGLGESVARVLASNHPAPQEFVATKDTFGESGTPEQLMEKYGLNNKAIEAAVLKVLKRK